MEKMEDLEKKFDLLREDMDISMQYSAKMRIKILLEKLEELLREALEQKKKYLLAAYYFLPDEIASCIEEAKFKLKEI